ncbi:hypothetical protein ATERTT37_002375 [Aspergillus terreus]
MIARITASPPPSQYGPPFRVIIVGAGVAGLTLAHCLDKAGIDYLVLDKGVVAPAAGYDTRTLNRQLFLRILYNHLPDQSKVLEHHCVVDITEETDSMRVILSDGTEYVADLVVGADGVHSKMREIMWEKANATIPHFISAAEKRCMSHNHTAIWECPPIPGLGLHDMHSISNDRFSFLLLCQPTFISYIAHCKLPQDQQCVWPNRARFTDDDMEALARKLADYPICESVVFGELWRRRTKAQLISLEEGVLDHWFFGRTVLTGDAVHKVTPNSALGGCTAMEDAVAITNQVHELLNRHPNKKPSTVEIAAAMQEYQDSRLERVKTIVKVGGDLTRLQAYDGWYFYIMQRWVTPWIGLDTLAINIAKLCSAGTKLSFVDFAEQKGLLGWQDTIEAETMKERANKRKAKRLVSQNLSQKGWNWQRELQRIWPLLVGLVLCLSSTLVAVVAVA